MKTKEEIINECDNEHDKELLIKEFSRWEIIHGKAEKLMWIATLFIVIGILGLFFNDYFILSFIPVFPLMFIAMFYNLKGSGLI